MNLKKIGLAAATAVAVLASAPAQAVFINGGISFNGGYDPGALSNLPTSLVSLLTTFDLSNAMLGVGGSGDLAPAAGIGVASDFTHGTGGVLYVGGGFTFTITSFGALGNVGMNCATAQCNDSRLFSAAGTVTGGIYQPTAFTMNWTSTGSCNESTTTPGQCGTTGITSQWGASISATGVAAPPPPDLPEPSALALVGLALAGLALSRKSKKA